ncbi:MAG: phosphoglycerate kinase [bacterium]|nr:phosphoglycerate kinase [bacterium]
MIKYINELKPEELAGKKVLMRVDFDVPVNDEGKIVDTFRIVSHRLTLSYLLAGGAKVILVSHLGSLDGFVNLTEEIGSLLGQVLTLVPLSELDSIDALFRVGPVLLLDNVRQDPREVENNPAFAKELAEGFDFYVNDAFAAAHRAHASLAAIAQHLPSYGGLLLKEELERLGEILTTPPEGKVVVLGGAKISTKLPVIENLLNKTEKIIIGGALANNFFKAQGFKIGASVVDDSAVLSFLSPPEIKGEEQTKIVLPQDIIISTKPGGKIESSGLKDIGFSQLIVDIGPASAEAFAEMIKNAKMVIWNGPMGQFEVENFDKGTEAVAKAVAEAKKSIIGGGDTLAAIKKFGLEGKFDYVSTGGGAMLEFLSGNRLAALEALGYYKN